MTTNRDPENNEPHALFKMADFSGQRVLEIGCGEGRLTWRYARAARRVTAIEIGLDELRVATIDRPSDLAEKVVFTNANSVHLPFSKETFDIALLSWSL
jgi:ubiquinone/menaquinone biosynthesis C-methylase UbiE